MRGFRKCCVSVVAWMLFGAIVTLALSWAIALLSPIRRVEIDHSPGLAGARLSSATVVPSDWDIGCRVLGRGIGVRYELVTEMYWAGSTLGSMSGSMNRSIERVATGWPLASMEWAGKMDERRRYQSYAMPDGLDVRAGLTPPVTVADLYQGADRRLPLVPLWPAFAINTLVWGLVGWMSMMLPRAWRMRCRRQRGLCEACAYPVAGVTRCSECGREVAGVVVAKSAASAGG